MAKDEYYQEVILESGQRLVLSVKGEWTSLTTHDRLFVGDLALKAEAYAESIGKKRRTA